MTAFELMNAAILTIGVYAVSGMAFGLLYIVAHKAVWQVDMPGADELTFVVTLWPLAALLLVVALIYRLCCLVGSNLQRKP